MQQRADDPQIAALFEAVYADPGADAPRLVLADALMERDDLRGEFIALQLRLAEGARGAKLLERERELIETHWRAWLSDLPGIQRLGLDLHRGFLRGCAYQPSGKGTSSPLWRTVEWLRVVNPKNPVELGAPGLAGVKRLEGLDGACLSEVLGGDDKPRLEELEFAGPWQEGERGARERRMVQALVRLPSLTTLTLSPTPFRHHASHLGWLLESTLAKKLIVLRLRVDFPVDVAGLYELLVSNGLESLKIEAATPGVSVLFDRGWMRIEFDSPASVAQRAAAVRNLLPHVAPFPWRRFDVFVGSRRATQEELEQLGETAVRYAG